jgi:hypothetical protein
MRRVIIVALWVGIGCKGGHKQVTDAGPNPDAPVDAAVCVPLTPPSCNPTMAPTTPAAGSGACNVLAQTGCATMEKCTWIQDAANLGRIGCTPDGMVQLECACTRGALGTTGYDDCQKGGICIVGVCKQICDQNGGAPMCNAINGAKFSCGLYSGIFGPIGGPFAAGACDPQCDPIGDNDFFGSGHKTGCVCGSNEGCYGSPSATTGSPTAWTCSREVNKSLVHRTACTTAVGCADSAGTPFRNGCAQGYEPFLLDHTGSMQEDCIALCRPGNAYMGNPGTQLPAGKEPHACNSNDARGTFGTAATTTTNGEHCAFSWIFEIDTNGNLVRSPTSDTVGFCWDHTKYGTEPTGTIICTSPTTPAGCMPIPLCADLPLSAGSNQFKAGDFGCVDSHTGGFPRVVRPFADLRPLYHRWYSSEQ